LVKKAKYIGEKLVWPKKWFGQKIGLAKKAKYIVEKLVWPKKVKLP